VLTLKQTGKVQKDLPVVLFGKTFWRSIINWQARETPRQDRTRPRHRHRLQRAVVHGLMLVVAGYLPFKGGPLEMPG
jgi:predicted Rossmann-fold nucleotide-binding protein